MGQTTLLTMLLCCGIISAQDWKNVGNCGAGLECGPQCQRLCLMQHNYYRSLHHSPPLKCDPQLAESAQSWADFMASQETVHRSKPTNDYAESISWKVWGWKGMETKLGAIPGAVRSWYSELKRGYDYNTGKGNVTHFKSVVDAREARLGCGIKIRPGDGTYVVAHYSLRPGQKFKLNDFTLSKDVQIRKQPDPRCTLKSFEREQCGKLKSPLITPDKCIKAGCCYDDMFMDEPSLQWHNENASIWCFKMKDILSKASSEGPAQQLIPLPKLASLQTTMLGGRPAQQPTNQPPGGTVVKCSAISCYKFVGKGKTWDRNRDSCKAEGGDLVSMETEPEWQFVNSEMQLITIPGVNEWHIGLKNQGGWQWVSGKPLTIKKWQRYEPSGDGNVAVMSKDYPPGSEGLFNDLNGQYPKPFICETPKGAKPPAPPVTTAVPPGGTTPPLGSTQGSTVSPSERPPTPPGGGGGGGTEGMTGFEQDCLKAHNEYRAKHGVPPLKWNAQLKADAQTWANHLADINQMVHDTESIENGSGENLAYFSPGDPNNMPTQCQGPKTPSCVQCREMVADWYAEEPNFDYNTGESKGGVILHFTQVVWKETTELGMATATSANKWFTVARYKKRGNMGYPQDYIENVPRPL